MFSLICLMVDDLKFNVCFLGDVHQARLLGIVGRGTEIQLLAGIISVTQFDVTCSKNPGNYGQFQTLCVGYRFLDLCFIFH